MIKTILNLTIAIHKEDQIKHLFKVIIIINLTKFKIFEVKLK